MSVSDLSRSTQDYLKVIWGLQEWSEDPVTASMIASKSGMKLSTVSGAVTKLVEQGFVTREAWGDVSLTASGRAHGMAYGAPPQTSGELPGRRSRLRLRRGA